MPGEITQNPWGFRYSKIFPFGLGIPKLQIGFSYEGTVGCIKHILYNLPVTVRAEFWGHSPALTGVTHQDFESLSCKLLELKIRSLSSGSTLVQQQMGNFIAAKQYKFKFRLTMHSSFIKLWKEGSSVPFPPGTLGTGGCNWCFLFHLLSAD